MGVETAVAIVLVLTVLAAAGYWFIRCYPAFGGRSSGEAAARIAGSSHYAGGKFINPIPTTMSMSGKTMFKIMLEMIKGHPASRPRQPLPVRPLEYDRWKSAGAGQASVVWLGHSTLLLTVGGKTLFLDPMLGRAPSPFPFVGGKRYSRSPPIDIDALPSIDAVILSHDHYDHLDYGSIRRLKGKVGHFFAPLGVGAHLIRWGVDPRKVTECDWWEEASLDGLRLACAPARHFSGRSVGDRFRTLWCSWVIDAGDVRIFFGGDSGYGPHFAAIGDKYGPFDLTLMECGQYDERWKAIHMLPEETVEAHLDVRGRVLLPIHWGAFTLALHSWTDPAERVRIAANKRGVRVTTPALGEPVAVGTANYPEDPWWDKAR